jgi:hypothetical protein
MLCLRNYQSMLYFFAAMGSLLGNSLVLHRSRSPDQGRHRTEAAWQQGWRQRVLARYPLHRLSLLIGPGRNSLLSRTRPREFAGPG